MRNFYESRKFKYETTRRGVKFLHFLHMNNLNRLSQNINWVNLFWLRPNNHMQMWERYADVFLARVNVYGSSMCGNSFLFAVWGQAILARGVKLSCWVARIYCWVGNGRLNRQKPEEKWLQIEEWIVMEGLCLDYGLW